MSRLLPSAASTSLTDELDKLEQSITLTLQEIDHNFSRAHAIVNSSILPIVEKYAQHSIAVWEGSQFWKKIFEASANVSLSGVEEQNDHNENLTSVHSPENTAKYTTGLTSVSDDEKHYSAKEDESEPHDDADSFLGHTDFTQSTPRVSESDRTWKDTHHMEYGPSTENSKKDATYNLKNKADDYETTGHDSIIFDETKPPIAALCSPINDLLSLTQNRPGPDPLLHRVLDKNYRLQATPLAVTRKKNISSKISKWSDFELPDSSPLVSAPQLHADLFSSPTRPRNKLPVSRTPRVDDRTPVKTSPENSATKPSKNEISWESDSEEDAEGIYRELGMSPPKTIQFILPQSKILQTPAREASQRIVQDLLATAGVGFNASDTEDTSSLVVRNLIDEDF